MIISLSALDYGEKEDSLSPYYSKVRHDEQQVDNTKTDKPRQWPVQHRRQDNF